MVGNMRKRKKGKKKTKKKAEAFAMAIKNVLKQPEKSAQRGPGEKGLRKLLTQTSKGVWRVPLLSTVIASPSIFTWVPLGIFLRLFQSKSNSHAGASVFPLSFFASYLPPNILYCNIWSEPVATD